MVTTSNETSDLFLKSHYFPNSLVSSLQYRCFYPFIKSKGMIIISDIIANAILKILSIIIIFDHFLLNFVLHIFYMLYFAVTINLLDVLMQRYALWHLIPLDFYTKNGKSIRNQVKVDNEKRKEEIHWKLKVDCEKEIENEKEKPECFCMESKSMVYAYFNGKTISKRN